jgi:GNAT superfamily N-acetyltransferase
MWRHSSRRRVHFDHSGLNFDTCGHPDVRSSGIGSALFRAAEDWSRTRHCRSLIVETQNINVAACRFYVRMGCALQAINCLAYPELPGEVQLLWCKDL